MIQPDGNRLGWGRIIDLILTMLILVSVSVVFVSTFDLPPKVQKTLGTIEGIVSIIFTIEYILRIATADFLFPSSTRRSLTPFKMLSPDFGGRF